MENVIEIDGEQQSLERIRSLPYMSELEGETKLLFVVAAMNLKGQIFACRMSDDADNNLKGGLVLPAFRINTDLNAPRLMAEFMKSYFGIGFFPKKPIGSLKREGRCSFYRDGVCEIHHLFWFGLVKDADAVLIKPKNEYSQGFWLDPKDLIVQIHGQHEPEGQIIEGINFSHPGMLVSAERHPLHMLRSIENEAKDHLQKLKEEFFR